MHRAEHGDENDKGQQGDALQPLHIKRGAQRGRGVCIGAFGPLRRSVGPLSNQRFDIEAVNERPSP